MVKLLKQSSISCTSERNTRGSTGGLQRHNGAEDPVNDIQSKNIKPDHERKTIISFTQTKKDDQAYGLRAGG